METVLGHTEQKLVLLQNYKKVNTWLLSGKRGIGKATLAKALARHVLQTSTLDSHPDVLILLEGDASPMTQVREVKHFLNMSPINASRKVVILDNTDDLNENATSALLKTLEEPSANSLILLISHVLHNIPIVLRSRCVILPFQELSVEESLQVIKINCPTLEFADVAASLYPGAPGMITEKIADEVFLYKSIFSIIHKEGRFDVLENISEMDLSLEKVGYVVLKAMSDYIKDALESENISENSSKNVLHMVEKYFKVLQIFGTSRKLNIQKETTLFKALEVVRTLSA